MWRLPFQTLGVGIIIHWRVVWFYLRFRDLGEYRRVRAVRSFPSRRSGRWGCIRLIQWGLIGSYRSLIIVHPSSAPLLIRAGVTGPLHLLLIVRYRPGSLSVWWCYRSPSLIRPSCSSWPVSVTWRWGRWADLLTTRWCICPGFRPCSAVVIRPVGRHAPVIRNSELNLAW